MTLGRQILTGGEEPGKILLDSLGRRRLCDKRGDACCDDDCVVCLEAPLLITISGVKPCTCARDLWSTAFKGWTPNGEYIVTPVVGPIGTFCGLSHPGVGWGMGIGEGEGVVTADCDHGAPSPPAGGYRLEFAISGDLPKFVNCEIRNFSTGLFLHDDRDDPVVDCGDLHDGIVLASQYTDPGCFNFVGGLPLRAYGGIATIEYYNP